MTKKYYTDYATASSWGDQSLILCNKIAEIDNSIYDNMRFSLYENDSDYPIDIFQWFLTDLTEWEVEWQERNFPELKYTYSDLLDCYVLCVDHLGTAWKSVRTEVSAELFKYNKDIEYKGF